MILEQIVNSKKIEIANQEAAVPLGILTSALAKLKKTRSFRNNLQNGSGLNIIAEIKRASPVKGILCSTFDPVKLARDYQNGGAGAISVITEENYFKGSPAFIAAVKAAVDLPVLRKDFIISDYQVYESRVLGADAVLLIASILDDYYLRKLIRLSANLGMDALVEVHDHNDLKKALAAEANLIGINNRNLKTFEVNLSTTLQMTSLIPEDVLIVSESGIASRQDILQLEQAGIKAALVGEILVRSEDPCAMLRELRGLAGIRAEKQANMSCG